MIFCSICGTENLKDNNYCTHCGNRIAIENICPNCGTVNEDSLSYCKNCNEQLKPIFISDFDLLFTDYNKNLLENADLSVNDYMNILRNTFKKAEFTKIKGHYPKDKVLSLAKTFANCRAKSRGA